MCTPRLALLLIFLCQVAACSRAAPDDPAVTLAEGCIDVGVKACSTDEGGYLRHDGRFLFWQIQSGEAPSDIQGAAWVLASRTPEGGFHPLASSTEGDWYEAPRRLWMKDSVYLAIAGGLKGTGHFNADAIYRWTADPARPLIKIETEGWRRNVVLPDKLSIRKGVVFSYGDTSIQAETALWRGEDGDCCPSGGSATLHFDIRNDVLHLTSIERHTP